MTGPKHMDWDKQTGYFGPIFAVYLCRGSKYSKIQQKKKKKSCQ